MAEGLAFPFPLCRKSAVNVIWYYDLVSLAEAREKRDTARKQVQTA